ncbi:MAG: hypothetical protein DRP26_04315 [Candidatus Zixiibacteriota bacterium]|nr:MAG: hypothetical protein DRP26_04315 [candidate division Zixibacteria bacterium]
MMKSLIKIMVVTFLMVLVFGSVSYSETLVRLDHPDLDDINVIGFELKKKGEIDIEAVGLRLKYRDDLNVYTWIIDYDTREPVWVMKDTRTSKVKGRRILRMAKASETLDKGKYELYLYSGSRLFSGISIHGTGDFFEFLGDLFKNDRYEEFEDYLDDCYVELSSDEISKGDIKIFDVNGDLPGALIKFNKLGDYEYVKRGFTVDTPMNLHIYAIFEFPSGNRTPVDYGWIIDADTRDKVWEIDRWNTDWAGGSRKNRKFDDEVHFKKGDYILYFVTDDSHSYELFNANPPYDPLNWGITILPGKDFKPSAFHDYEPATKSEPLIDFTQAQDNDYYEQPFKLLRETSLHIYAIGEYSYSNHEFVDYGWIQDAATGKMIWEMTSRNTQHAGGAKKNRMFDDNVTLPEGEYIAYYITDDSHSYLDWNDSPPFDPKSWGLAIYPAPEFKKEDFKKLSSADITVGSNILVKMVRVRDHEKKRDKFTLDKQTRIHIYAIGEGDRDEMYDYGWIIDDRTNRTVWEMTWRNTEHAGGARKNRLYDDDIILDPGTYEVFYITDGSHSFNDWNSPKPRDPINWGITISIVEK